MPAPQPPYILVDTSYISYVAISSCWSSYKEEFNVKPDESFDPTSDIDFLKSVDSRIKQVVFNSCRKAAGMYSHDKVFFIFDCKKTDIWRCAIYPEYKLRRQTIKREFNMGPTFKYIKDIVIPNICEKYGSKTLEIPNCESDDIIGIIGLNTKKPLIIISSDGDYLQLEGTNIKQYDSAGNAVTLQRIKKKLGLLHEEFSNKDALLLKVLMGDAGDEVPAVKPKLGIKTAYKLMKDKKSLQNLLIDPIYKEAFIRNRTLVDFSQIPENIKNEIITLWRMSSGEQSISNELEEL